MFDLEIVATSRINHQDIVGLLHMLVLSERMPYGVVGPRGHGVQ